MQEQKRGAAPVNGDLEVGYDEKFERRWYSFQLVALLCMVTFLLVCLAGLLGRGPYSHRTAASPDATLRVDYEPVAREGTPTLVTLHAANPADTSLSLRVFVSGEAAEPLGLDHTLPAADAALVGDRGILFRFTLAPHQADAKIRLAAMPGAPGLARLRAWTGGQGDAPDPPDDRAVAHWSQLILP